MTDMTMLELLTRAVFIGIVATATFDLWAVLLRLTLGTPTPDWALLARWIAHLRTGRIVHDNIKLAPASPHEQVVGWLVHYTVGMVFAAILLLLAGSSWARAPTLLPALIAGFATIPFIWCVLMPAFGHGFAASKSPIANRIRAINIVSHAVLGVSFYTGARLLNALLTATGVA
ncbi:MULTISPECIES: DUF2938 family protein [unclassified Beijerinckia]|uniref:DUF2938 family protein n=1 Tax=unclassified Beijerinckia TaxID=2638183 RepID=UPI00089D46EF|nr:MULTISPECIES: DUF2938 family protein [unclassified Beijerinckia]MDH7797479.1 hypothetical protein [Beijerinckia sp. GAS462]SEC87287.1 Protein of unknown function [Beijerinckia sp. 28-YEA-48]